MTEEKEREIEKFVENYKPGFIDSKLFEEAKAHPGRFVFSKTDIMQEIGWKNGTFYNRFNELDILRPGFRELYTKRKEEGDKVERLFFCYEAFCEFLRKYYIKDRKC